MRSFSCIMRSFSVRPAWLTTVMLLLSLSPHLTPSLSLTTFRERTACQVSSPGAGCCGGGGGRRAQPGGTFIREYSCTWSEGACAFSPPHAPAAPAHAGGSAFQSRKHCVQPGFMLVGTHGGYTRLLRRATQSTLRNHLCCCVFFLTGGKTIPSVGVGATFFWSKSEEKHQ